MVINQIIKLFSGVVECIIITLFCYTLLSLKYKDKRLIPGLIILISVNLILLPITNVPLLLPFTCILLYMLFFKCFYKKHMLVGFITAVLSVIIYLFVEIIVMSFLFRITNLEFYDVYDINSKMPDIRLLFFLCQALVYLIIMLVIRISGFSLEKFFDLISIKQLKIIADDDIDFDKEKRVSFAFYLVIAFLLTQALYINGHNWLKSMFTRSDHITISSQFANTVIILLNIVLLFLLRYLVVTMRRERNEVVRRIKEKNSLRLDWEKRAQIHDCWHHLGMLYMLLQMDNIDKASEYLKGMVGEIQNVDAIIKSGSQTLNALLMGKISLAKHKDITIKIDVISRLGQMNVADWDLNRIIGNLLDNAIEAVEKREGEKLVELIIEGGNENNRIEVITHGVVIPDEKESHIFLRGYSSKEEKDHGLGLAICKELVENYDGDIFISKDREKEYTSFTVLLPVIEKKR